MRQFMEAHRVLQHTNVAFVDRSGGFLIGFADRLATIRVRAHALYNIFKIWNFKWNILNITYQTLSASPIGDDMHGSLREAIWGPDPKMAMYLYFLFTQSCVL